MSASGHRTMVPTPLHTGDGALNGATLEATARSGGADVDGTEWTDDATLFRDGGHEGERKHSTGGTSRVPGET